MSGVDVGLGVVPVLVLVLGVGLFGDDGVGGDARRLGSDLGARLGGAGLDDAGLRDLDGGGQRHRRGAAEDELAPPDAGGGHGRERRRGEDLLDRGRRLGRPDPAEPDLGAVKLVALRRLHSKARAKPKRRRRRTGSWITSAQVLRLDPAGVHRLGRGLRHGDAGYGSIR